MTIRNPAGFSTRRHRPGAAAVAYSHALAVTDNTAIAESVAAASLRRGAHSRLAVIAHARHQALEHARRSPVQDSDGIAGPDLLSLAKQLARTRPVLERAIVDLELRYSLDASSFARVLGLTNGRAGERSTAIAKTWAETLDPAVMAWLGPGSCDGLAALLTAKRLWPRTSETAVVSSVDTTGPVPLLSTGTDGPAAEAQTSDVQPVSIVTIGALLEAAGTVRIHAEACGTCNERLRMLTPVRSLMGQQPLEEVPPPVTAAAKSAHRRIPTPLPPSIEPLRLDISRFREPSMIVLGVLLAAVLVVIAFNVRADDGPSQADRVAELVQAPAPSNLLATPSTVTRTTKTASIADNGTAPLTWNAAATVPWITFEPSSGQLAPARTTSIKLKIAEPTGNHDDAIITITSSDGSKQTLRFRSMQ